MCLQFSSVIGLHLSSPSIVFQESLVFERALQHLAKYFELLMGLLY